MIRTCPQFSCDRCFTPLRYDHLHSFACAHCPAAQPILYWCSRNMSFWSSISFNLAVLMNLLVAFFYPLGGVRGGWCAQFLSSFNTCRTADVSMGARIVTCVCVCVCLMCVTNIMRETRVCGAGKARGGTGGTWLILWFCRRPWKEMEARLVMIGLRYWRHLVARCL